MEIKQNNIEAKQLVSYIERIEKLESDANNIKSDIREVYAEAKSVGYNPKIMRAIIKLRKMEEADKVQQDEELEAYRVALDI